jgi:hypothetical protein
MVRFRSEPPDSFSSFINNLCHSRNRAILRHSGHQSLIPETGRDLNLPQLRGHLTQSLSSLKCNQGFVFGCSVVEVGFAPTPVTLSLAPQAQKRTSVGAQCSHALLPSTRARRQRPEGEILYSAYIPEIQANTHNHSARAPLADVSRLATQLIAEWQQSVSWDVVFRAASVLQMVVRVEKIGIHLLFSPERAVPRSWTISVKKRTLPHY